MGCLTTTVVRNVCIPIDVKLHSKLLLWSEDPKTFVPFDFLFLFLKKFLLADRSAKEPSFVFVLQPALTGKGYDEKFGGIMGSIIRPVHSDLHQNSLSKST